MPDNRQVAATGERIARILANEDFQDAIRSSQEQIRNEWEGSPVWARRKRERLHQELGAMKRVLKRLRKSVTDGEVARAALNKENINERR